MDYHKTAGNLNETADKSLLKRLFRLLFKASDSGHGQISSKYILSNIHCYYAHGGCFSDAIVTNLARGSHFLHSDHIYEMFEIPSNRNKNPDSPYGSFLCLIYDLDDPRNNCSEYKYYIFAQLKCHFNHSSGFQEQEASYFYIGTIKEKFLSDGRISGVCVADPHTLEYIPQFISGYEFDYLKERRFDGYSKNFKQYYDRYSSGYEKPKSSIRVGPKVDHKEWKRYKKYPYHNRRGSRKKGA